MTETQMVVLLWNRHQVLFQRAMLSRLAVMGSGFPWVSRSFGIGFEQDGEARSMRLRILTKT